jgi:thiamine-phosphate pyrophosphorylase
LGDGHLTARCKALRHQLVAALQPIPRNHLLSSRDTLGDVGTPPLAQALGQQPSAIASERSSALQVAIVNSERIKQAIRALEEYAKLAYPSIAREVEALRYQWYTLEKALQITADSRQRLAGMLLYVLIDGGSSECAFVERVRELLAAGVTVLQLRDKKLVDRDLLVRARLLRRTLDEAGSAQMEGEARALFIMNDRPDLALLAQADGVHVGQDELSVSDVRQLVGPHMIIGVSTHTIAEARQAVLDGANYLGCGPVFASQTKAFNRFPGLDFLREVAAEISLPAFAIGGIDSENLAEVRRTGFTRVAIGSAIWNAPDPQHAASAFQVQLAADRSA